MGIWAFGANRKIDSLENILPPGPEGALDARFSKTVAPGIRRGGVDTGEQACCSQRGELSACQSPHRPPPALSPLAVGHLRSATRRLLQCQPPAGPSAHSLVQFLVARHAQTAQPNAATKTATSWPICAFASAIPGAETRRTAQPTTATKATSLFSRQN